jgi:hypothetical protein
LCKKQRVGLPTFRNIVVCTTYDQSVEYFNFHSVGSSEDHWTFDNHAADVVEVAGIWALKILADRGIGPQIGKQVASWLAYGIAYHALREIDLEDQVRKNLVARLRKKTFEGIESFITRTTRTESPWINQTLKRLAHSRGQKAFIPSRFLIWWPDGSYEWSETVGSTILAEEDRQGGGAVIFLDQMALGRELRRRAGKPLVPGKDRILEERIGRGPRAL